MFAKIQRREQFRSSSTGKCMEKIWIAINVLVIGMAVLDGFVSISPEKLAHKNPDLFFRSAILVITPIFALLTVSYSIHRHKHDMIRRPSLRRNPLNWWHDPLQSLFMSTCIMASMTLGGLLRHPAVGSVGFWMVGSYTCFALGLMIGQLLIYRIYRDKIVAVQHAA